MKKTIIIIFAALLAFAACTEKEKDNVAAANPSQREVTYTVDTREHTAVLQTDDEWTGLVYNLIDSAFRGRNMTVAIDNIEHKPIPTKEVITYTTNSRDSAEAWIARMTENGYRVAFSYDETSCTYNCVAMDYSTFPDDAYRFMPLSEYIIGTWVLSGCDIPDTFSFYPDGTFVSHCINATNYYFVVNDSTLNLTFESGSTSDKVIQRLSMDTLSVQKYTPHCSALYVIFNTVKFARIEM
ncbi:MAG: hypothetical protein K6F85_04085 [Bacteroidales bacterium]|nr:hypothetical protein [Bacteroidales bacterium]